MGSDNMKIQNFSIWNSVVNDRIVENEKLTVKLNEKDTRIQELTDENGLVKEKADVLFAELKVIKGEIELKQCENDELRKQVNELRSWISNMENSTSWKLTKPIRTIFNVIRGIQKK